MLVYMNKLFQPLLLKRPVLLKRLIWRQCKTTGPTPWFTHQDGRRIINQHLPGTPAKGVPDFFIFSMRRPGVKLFEKYFWKIFSRLVHRRWLLLLVTILAAHGCMAPMVEEEVKPVVSEQNEAPAEEYMGLMGEWCLVKKRRVTRYTVNEGKLRIRSGRSGQLHEADLSCDDAYTACEAKTIRGWGTPVTEFLRLDGENMNLTRVWGGSWKDKTYNFAFTRCPKW